MPIAIGDTTAEVIATINAIISNAGLDPSGNTGTTSATDLLNQVADLYGLPGLADGMGGAEARSVINSLESGSPYGYNFAIDYSGRNFVNYDEDYFIVRVLGS